MKNVDKFRGIPPPKKVSITGYFDPKYPVFDTFFGGGISGEPSKNRPDSLESPKLSVKF